MHPAMAVWIWSMAMARAWQPAPWYGNGSVTGPDQGKPVKRDYLPRVGSADQCMVLANNYLHSEVSETPLPDTLMDRLADLYWTERDEELAI